MYREARLAAIADARRRADDYAAAFGTTVADLVEVSDLNTGFGGVREMRAFAMGQRSRGRRVRVRAGYAERLGSGDRPIQSENRVPLRSRSPH